MSTMIIEGVTFQLPEATSKQGSNRGRKSPKGKSTKLPFNKFVWQLLNENAHSRKLTDNQITNVIWSEFKEESAIRERIEKDWSNGTSTTLSQARSHFNRNCLVTGAEYDFPSFSLNANGNCIWPESGRLMTRQEVIKKIVCFGVSLQNQNKFLAHYQLE